jgi:hypothetical protein
MGWRLMDRAYLVPKLGWSEVFEEIKIELIGMEYVLM